MGSIGIVGLFFLAVLILLIFGGRLLPQWGRSLGSGMRGFTTELKSGLKGEDEEQEELQQASPPPTAVSGERRPERERVSR
jgi:Sec-independent protein translocase protein TatA